MPTDIDHEPRPCDTADSRACAFHLIRFAEDEDGLASACVWLTPVSVGLWFLIGFWGWRAISG